MKNQEYRTGLKVHFSRDQDLDMSKDREYELSCMNPIRRYAYLDEPVKPIPNTKVSRVIHKGKTARRKKNRAKLLKN